MSVTRDETRWRIELDDHVSALAWAPDGTRLVAGSLGGDVRLLDGRTGEPIAKLPHHPLGVLAVAWSADGTRLAVGGQDGLLRVSDGEGAEVATAEHDDWIAALAWSGESGLLAAAAGRDLLILDRTGAERRRYDPAPSTITSLAWSADGSRVGAGAYGGLRWHDPAKASTTPIRTFEWKGSLLSIVVAPNGRWACAGSQDNTVHLWKLWSGDDLSMSGYPAKIEHLAFTHDSRWMANACLGEINVWDFSGKGPAGTAPAQGEAHDRHIAALAWRPGGDLLATGGAEGRLALWPPPHRKGQALTPDRAHDGPVGIACLAWAPDGSALAIGRGDGTVELSLVS